MSRSLGRVARLPEAAWFAYPAVLAVQARALWGAWDSDLTAGDTAGYWGMADLWHDGGEVDFAWSPLYTAFYGSVRWLGGDAVDTTIAHRVMIVAALTLLVLALSRRLLPAWAALLIACWWAILPIVFDNLYEVHLFATLPLLAAVLLLTNDPGPWRRGAAVAVLLAAALLVRNEFAVALAALAAGLVGAGWRARRAGGGRVPAAAYAVPAAAALLLALTFYSRSIVKGDELRDAFDAKHKLTVCQSYGTNYQQRHPRRFPGSAFTDCGELMQTMFGEPSPSALTAWRENPRAMAGFTAWNLRLLPHGLQLGLLNAVSNDDNPDYPEARLDRALPAILGLALLLLLATGAVFLRRDYGYWRSALARQRWAWAALGAVALMAVFVALNQRPRPPYMFGLITGLMAASALAAAIVVRRLELERPASLLAAGLPVALLAVLPQHYRGDARPLADLYHRLEPLSGRIARGHVVVVPSNEDAACLYLAPNESCRALGYSTAVAPRLANQPLGAVLEAAGARVLYADPALASQPPVAGLIARPGRAGWRVARSGTDAQGRWAVLVRR